VCVCLCMRNGKYVIDIGQVVQPVLLLLSPARSGVAIIFFGGEKRGYLGDRCFPVRTSGETTAGRSGRISQKLSVK